MHNCAWPQVRLSLGSFLGQGPEQSAEELDRQKLAFMRRAWVRSTDGTGEICNPFL